MTFYNIDQCYVALGVGSTWPVAKSAALVLQRSRVPTPNQPEFFQAFISQLQQLHL